jgi:hypothetical protein
MTKYSFDRFGPETFEELVAAVLEAHFAATGMIHFGPGRDGGREATWRQPVEHPTFVAPASGATHRDWVFQAKHHNTTRPRSKELLEILRTELNLECEKIKANNLPCDSFVLITNVPLTGVRDTGMRDRLEVAASDWRTKFNEVHIWDGNKLGAILDSHPGIRTTYLDQILPGDILQQLCDERRTRDNQTAQILRAYLLAVLENAGYARASEAGDESDKNLTLEQIYTDLTLSTEAGGVGRSHSVAQYWSARGQFLATRTPMAHTATRRAFNCRAPAAAALLQADQQPVLLLAGPGYGKSTVCQFIATLQAARSLGDKRRDQANKLMGRMDLPSDQSIEEFDNSVPVRLPFRIELRKYGEWRTQTTAASMAEYIATQLIGKESDTDISRDQVYNIIQNTPSVLILDGLDEVPNSDVRAGIISDLQTFARRARDTASPTMLSIILSTRPQGYNREFDILEPFIWSIEDLDQGQFWNYCDSWLLERVPDRDDRQMARARVDSGLDAIEVRALATTLLQATVILTIAKNKHDIPHERTTLFERYVATIFEREKEKRREVKRFEMELRRLHELLGYDLHRSMESGGNGAVKHDRFREYAMRVWEMYRGTEPLLAGLTATVENITELARDRLVFLAGRGEEQGEIGFIISSFREYFAARYFVEHEEADRDKVFHSLIAREGHWENVLKFYVGAQQPADQRHWATTTEDDAQAAMNQGDFIAAIRYRRTLLTILPEFRSLPSKTLSIALANALNPSTIWSWLDTIPLASVVRSIRGGSLLPDAIRTLVEIATEDPDNSTHGIRLCAALLWIEHREMVPLRSIIEKNLALPLERDALLQTIVDYDMSECAPRTASPLEWALAQRRSALASTKDSLAKKVSDDVICAVFLRNNRATCSQWSQNPLMSTLLANTEEASVTGTNPYLAQAVFTEANSVAAATSELNGQHARYIHALARADADYTNPEFDAHARCIELQLIAENTIKYKFTRAPFSLASGRVLGPPAERFSSVEKWIGFRALVATIRGTSAWSEFMQCCIDSGTGGKASWLLAYTHPSTWAIFARRGEIDQELVDSVPSSVRRCLELSSTPLLPFSTTLPYVRQLPYSPFDSVRIFETLIDAADSFGIGHVGRGWGGGKHLVRLGPAPLTPAQFDRVAPELRKRDLLGWLNGLILCAVWSPGVPPEMVLKHAEGLRCDFVGCGQAPADTTRDPIARLGEFFDIPNALPLVAPLVAASRHATKGIRTEKLASSLLQAIQDPSLGEEARILYINSLLALPPTDAEVGFWWTDEMAPLLASPGWNARMTERMRHAGVSLAALADVLTNRQLVSKDVQAAALGRLIEQARTKQQPLGDEHWKLDD